MTADAFAAERDEAELLDAIARRRVERDGKGGEVAAILLVTAPLLAPMVQLLHAIRTVL